MTHDSKYSLPERLLFIVALSMFVVMIFLTIAQVLFRYLLQIPVPWTEEAARVLFILSVMSGIAFAYKENQHIFVDFLFNNFTRSTQRRLTILFDLGILAFLAFWLRGAWKLMHINWASELITISWFRISYLYMWEFAMIILLGIYIIADLKKCYLRNE